jgi:hypothetical protein
MFNKDFNKNLKIYSKLKFNDVSVSYDMTYWHWKKYILVIELQ